MAIYMIKTRNELENLNVLAPERYDPRRDVLSTNDLESQSVPLASIVRLIKKTVGPSSENTSSCIVIDTSDARGGILNVNREPVTISNLGSQRKLIEPNDLIISRLRPYLRQVAFVDSEVPYLTEKIFLVCSTEFFVLRSVEMSSIAFLVPFLLSEPVQRVLAAAQEGGHHPRFNEATLLGLPIHKSLLDQRDDISNSIEESVRLFRRSETMLLNAVRSIESKQI